MISKRHLGIGAQHCVWYTCGMSIEGIPGIEYPELNTISTETEKEIDEIFSQLRENGFDVAPSVEAAFKNRDFYNALPQDLKNDPELLAEYAKNSSMFDSIISKERRKRWDGDVRGLLGEKIIAPNTFTKDGRKRREESGYRLDIEYLTTLGIDPSKILFYRRTDSSEEAKPELFWTSDFSEVAHGLQAEIPVDRREDTVVLVMDLKSLDSLGNGLLHDVNDDSGMSVRLINQIPIGHDKALVIIKNPKFTR